MPGALPFACTVPRGKCTAWPASTSSARPVGLAHPPAPGHDHEQRPTPGLVRADLATGVDVHDGDARLAAAVREVDLVAPRDAYA